MNLAEQLRQAYHNDLTDVPLLPEAADQLDRQQAVLTEIADWAEAYPLTVFPEPDLKQAAALLEAGGMTLDSISASAMRHVVTQVALIARKALT